MSDMLVVGGYQAAGYNTIIVDDCWPDMTRDKVQLYNNCFATLNSCLKSVIVLSSDKFFLFDYKRIKNTLLTKLCNQVKINQSSKRSPFYCVKFPPAMGRFSHHLGEDKEGKER